MKTVLLTGLVLLASAFAHASGEGDWANEELGRQDGIGQARSMACENRNFADSHTRRHNRFHNEAACRVRDYNGRIWTGYADNAEEACGEAVASCSREANNWPCRVVSCYR